MFLASALALCLAAVPIDVATARFEDITSAVSANGRQKSREIMEAWVAAHPTDPNAGRGIIWIAQLWIAEDHPREAWPYYERAAREYPGTEWGNHGIRGMAELNLDRWHFGAAIDGYATLAQNPAPFWNYIGRTGLDRARSERLRFWFFLAAAGLLLALCGGRLYTVFKSGERLWKLPEECVYALPIFALMIIASFRQPPDEGRAVIAVALGGAFLLWANGLYLRARPPQRAGRIVEAVLGLAQAAALLYCAVIVTGVWSKFHETLVMGAE